MLQVLKFNPILKELIWGGDYLYQELSKGNNLDAKVGESWELSTVGEDVSIVSEGEYKGRSLVEMIKTYQDRLVGKKIYEEFGDEFPLLVKIIDAQADLSVQVHPNEEFAQLKYGKHGKTEMWYVLDAKPDAKIVAGLQNTVDKATFVKAIEDNTVEQLLRKDDAIPGDVFYIPAGRIHALGAGNIIVEFQQTSDITFRVYDYDRRDAAGNPRELHVEEAIEVSNFEALADYKESYQLSDNASTNLVSSPFFVTNKVHIDKDLDKDYSDVDSFVILLCTKGSVELDCASSKTSIKKGETVLVPAEVGACRFVPQSDDVEFLEVYIS